MSISATAHSLTCPAPAGAYATRVRTGSDGRRCCKPASAAGIAPRVPTTVCPASAASLRWRSSSPAVPARYPRRVRAVTPRRFTLTSTRRNAPSALALRRLIAHQVVRRQVLQQPGRSGRRLVQTGEGGSVGLLGQQAQRRRRVRQRARRLACAVRAGRPGPQNPVGGAGVERVHAHRRGVDAVEHSLKGRLQIEFGQTAAIGIADGLIGDISHPLSTSRLPRLIGGAALLCRPAAHHAGKGQVLPKQRPTAGQQHDGLAAIVHGPKRPRQFHERLHAPLTMAPGRHLERDSFVRREGPHRPLLIGADHIGTGRPALRGKAERIALFVRIPEPCRILRCPLANGLQCGRDAAGLPQERHVARGDLGCHHGDHVVWRKRGFEKPDERGVHRAHRDRVGMVGVEKHHDDAGTLAWRQHPCRAWRR